MSTVNTNLKTEVFVSLFNFEGSFKREDGKDLTYGGVAQLGEHLPCKQGVMGSNPIISITHLGLSKIYWIVAQVVRAHA